MNESENLWSIDELFLTVRDNELRAYNRVMFMVANYKRFPALAARYRQVIASICASDGRDIELIRNKLNKEGHCTIVKKMANRLDNVSEKEDRSHNLGIGFKPNRYEFLYHRTSDQKRQ